MQYYELFLTNTFHIFYFYFLFLFLLLFLHKSVAKEELQQCCCWSSPSIINNSNKLLMSRITHTHTNTHTFTEQYNNINGEFIIFKVHLCNIVFHRRKWGGFFLYFFTEGSFVAISPKLSLIFNSHLLSFFIWVFSRNVVGIIKRRKTTYWKDWVWVRGFILGN